MANREVTVQIAAVALEALFQYGLPAMTNLITELNSKDEVTLEDIRAVRGELNSKDYFKPEDKGVDA